MAQLKTIAGIDATVRSLSRLLKAMNNEELRKSLRDPLTYTLVWCHELQTEEVTFKDPENIPTQLEKDIKEIAHLTNEATIDPPYQQQVRSLVEKLQTLTEEYQSSLNDSEDEQIVFRQNM